MYHNEDEELRALKKDDSYHFTIPFEYIKENHGNGNYDIGTTDMEVDVTWDDTELGYAITYHAPEMYLIDPAEGNGDEEEFYHSWVEPEVLSRLESIGITAEALVFGTGTCCEKFFL